MVSVRLKNKQQTQNDAFHQKTAGKGYYASNLKINKTFYKQSMLDNFSEYDDDDDDDDGDDDGGRHYREENGNINVCTTA